VVRYDALPARNGRGVHFVVETPRDGRAKVTFDPELGVFAYTRELAAGLRYPGNWGFVPSTLADDGDPLDALLLGDTTLWPGVVVTCRAVAVVRLTEPGEGSPKGAGDGERRRRGARIANDRVLLVAVDDDRQRGVRDVADVPRRTRLELARFFVAVTEFEKHGVAVRGWGNAAAADRAIDAAAARPAGRRGAAKR
jgi:inorganic pyrophosphatase